jgi:phosphotransferase system  glucose/maltose/N-acetylglucosamine-specific IIC component
MNQLDKRIQEALQIASELPEPVDETTLLQDILDTFQGKHRGLMILTGIKMAVVGVLMLLCIFQFFQQESMMAMMAYATATVVCAVSYGCIFLLLWSQMNHNTTEREIKRLELQVALLIRELKNKHQ